MVSLFCSRGDGFRRADPSYALPRTAALRDFTSPMSAWGQSRRIDMLARRAACPLCSESDRLQSGCKSVAKCRLCCKSLFALVIKIFPGGRRDFRVKIWRTSSPDEKLTDDLGNVLGATKIGGRRSDRLVAGKL